MGYQDITKKRDDYQNTILSLEKYYFKRIEKVITSDNFIQDLLLIEKETRENYAKYQNVWKLKDKIKVPAERLLRHHVYLSFSKDIEGIYPSPISSDLGFRTKDAVICIDSKTIDIHANKTDLGSTAVEMNQNSFDNSEFKYITTKSNLESIDHYSRLPVLTYIVKIIYHDDNYSFKLSRGKTPSLILVCIPNGQLSKLFENNIIDNFKTYNYYDEKDGDYYKPIKLPDIDDKKILDEYIINECIKKRKWIKVDEDDAKRFNSKYIFYDISKKQLWWLTSYKNKNQIVAVKSGSTVRYNNSFLSRRYDEKDAPWSGYEEYQIPDPL